MDHRMGLGHQQDASMDKPISYCGGYIGEVLPTAKGK